MIDVTDNNINNKKANFTIFDVILISGAVL